MLEDNTMHSGGIAWNQEAESVRVFPEDDLPFISESCTQSTSSNAFIGLVLEQSSQIKLVEYEHDAGKLKLIKHEAEYLSVKARDLASRKSNLFKRLVKLVRRRDEEVK